MNRVAIIVPKNSQSYAEICCSDCLRRNESPYCRILISTQSTPPNFEYEWYEFASKFVIYCDKGVTPDMINEIASLKAKFTQPFEYRNLFDSSNKEGSRHYDNSAHFTAYDYSD